MGLFSTLRNIPPHKAFLGMSAAATLAMGVLIKPWEGRIYVPTPDIGGVLENKIDKIYEHILRIEQ